MSHRAAGAGRGKSYARERKTGPQLGGAFDRRNFGWKMMVAKRYFHWLKNMYLFGPCWFQRDSITTGTISFPSGAKANGWLLFVFCFCGAQGVDNYCLEGITVCGSRIILVVDRLDFFTRTQGNEDTTSNRGKGGGWRFGR